MNPVALQLTIEHVGIAISAVTGVLAARGKRVDLFGVVVLAFVTAYGGGTTRDLLVGDLPPVWLRSSDYLCNAAITAVVTFYLIRLREIPHRVLLVADAAALALFTLIGARKGVALEFTPAVSVLLGVITGVAGGILRDVLLGEVPLVFRREVHLYATAGLGGAALYVGLHLAGVREIVGLVSGMILILALRLVAIRWKIGLPLLEAAEPLPPSPREVLNFKSNQENPPCSAPSNNTCNVNSKRSAPPALTSASGSSSHRKARPSGCRTGSRC